MQKSSVIDIFRVLNTPLISLIMVSHLGVLVTMYVFFILLLNFFMVKHLSMTTIIFLAFSLQLGSCFLFCYNIYNCLIKRLSADPTNWSNTLKQFIGNLPTNCLSVFDHFVGPALNGLRRRSNFLKTSDICPV